MSALARFDRGRYTRLGGTLAMGSARTRGAAPRGRPGRVGEGRRDTIHKKGRNRPKIWAMFAKKRCLPERAERDQ